MPEYSNYDDPDIFLEQRLMEKLEGKKKKKKKGWTNEVALSGSAAETSEEDYHAPSKKDKNFNTAEAAEYWIEAMGRAKKNKGGKSK